MTVENTKYDTLAIDIYDVHRRANPGWPAFFNMKRKERDYWRGLGQVAKENGSWDPPDYVPININTPII